MITLWCSVFVLLAVLYICLRPGLRRARLYIDQISTCGYLAPPPTPGGLRALMRTARVLAFIQVGPLKVIGRENFDLPDGPMIVTPNHAHSADTAVLPLVLQRPARYMAAQGVFRFAWGLGGLLVGPMGAFSADVDRGKGGPAREAAVRVLTTGQTLGMFPEGWAYLDGRMGPMKKGAVRIAKEAARQLGKTTYLVPVFIRYGRYPGSWILKFSPPVQYLIVFTNWWWFRRGATIVVGKPIPSTALPEDDGEATELLRQHIVALDPSGRNGEP
jgi:1-acyl-sn-glycerol-3-phosphate acyltransferase